MGKPGISVIMPCHNYGAYIEEAVDSIMAHNREGVPSELIIVDDGSDDGGRTAAALDRIENSPHPYPVKIIRNDIASGGPSKPRNDAIAQAQYDYICPVDADDRLNNNPDVMKNGSYFARALADMEADPGVAIVYADMHPFTEKDGYVNKTYPDTQPYGEDVQVRHGIIPAFGIYRRSDALASGGYDTQLRSQEDWVNYLGILNSRMDRGLPRTVKQYDEEYLDYRQHDNGGEGTVKSQLYKGTEEQQLEKRKLLYRRAVANAPSLLREHYPALDWNAPADKIAEEIRIIEEIRLHPERFNAAAYVNPRTYEAGDRRNAEHRSDPVQGADPQEKVLSRPTPPDPS